MILCGGLSSCLFLFFVGEDRLWVGGCRPDLRSRLHCQVSHKTSGSIYTHVFHQKSSVFWRVLASDWVSKEGLEDGESWAEHAAKWPSNGGALDAKAPPASVVFGIALVCVPYVGVCVIL